MIGVQGYLWCDNYIWKLQTWLWFILAYITILRPSQNYWVGKFIYKPKQNNTDEVLTELANLRIKIEFINDNYKLSEQSRNQLITHVDKLENLYEQWR